MTRSLEAFAGVGGALERVMVSLEMKNVDGEATGGLFWCRRHLGSGGGGAVGVGI